MAKIMIPTPLRKFADNHSSVEVNGNKLKDSIQQLATNYPDLGKQIMNGNGELQGFLKVFVGDEDISTLNGLETEISDKDVISIIPAIAGGY
jgi:adenylyltransferase/sulfurtransferase